MMMLTGMATAEAVTDDFRRASAFVRAYGVALGITVPEHVWMVAFPSKKLFPEYYDNWRKPEHLFVDLASILAWRQCLAVFADIDEFDATEETKEALRQTLMIICGKIYPASERSIRLMQKYASLLNDEAEQERLLEDYLMWERDPLITIHMLIVNECLEGPSLAMAEPGEDPERAFGMSGFAMKVYLEAVEYFKKRGSEIYEAHLANGER